MPLTTEEANALKVKQNALVDAYVGTSPSPTPPPTPGPTPPPTPSPTPPPSGWVKLEWKADGSNSRIAARSPCRVYFTVPDSAKNGGGRIVASYTSSAEQNFKSMVLSATPDGPPLAAWANIPQAKQPSMVWYVGAPPSAYYNPPISRGATYYVVIDNNPPVSAETNTNIWIDFDVPN